MSSLLHKSGVQDNFKVVWGLLRSHFVRDLSTVMLGTGVAQLVSFLLSPIVSRLFSPSDFGVYGSFNSVLGVIIAAVTLQYCQAIMLPKQKEDALNVWFAAGLSVGLISLLFLLAVMIFPSMILNLIDADNPWFLALLFIAVLVSGLNLAFQAWCVRVKDFKRTSASQVYRALSAEGLWIGLGLARTGAIGLVAGIVLANVVATLNLFRRWLTDMQALRFVVNWRKIKDMAYEYRDFPLYSTPQNVMNAVSQGLPVLLLANFYGAEVAGSYAFAVKVLGTPLRFVLTPLRQVLFQRASELYNQGENLYSLFLKMTGGLLLLIVIPALLVFAVAPFVFPWIFGEAWIEGGVYARWLIIWLAVGFCNVPAVLFARIVRKQKHIFIYEIVVLISRALVLIFGAAVLTAQHTVMAFSIIGSALNAFLIVWIGLKLRGNNENSHTPPPQKLQR